MGEQVLEMDVVLAVTGPAPRGARDGSASGRLDPALLCFNVPHVVLACLGRQ